MKKLAFVLAIAFVGAIALPSCKKDHTCNCTAAGVTTAHKIEKASKKDAKAACDAMNVAHTAAGGSCSMD